MKSTPTRLELFRRCPRRGAAERFYGLEEAGASTTDFGTLFHKELENHFRGLPINGLTPHGITALSAIGHYPEYEPGRFLTEHEWQISIGGRHTLTGTIDLLNLEAVEHPHLALVWDHKSTSHDVNPATGRLRWAKSEATLLRDVQSGWYAIASALEYGLESVACCWVYSARPRKDHAPRHEPVHFTHTPETLEPILRESVKILDAMQELNRPDLTWNQIPGNPYDCHSFGKPCAYILNCQDIYLPLQGLFPMTQPVPETAEQMMARIKAQAAASQQAAGAAPGQVNQLPLPAAPAPSGPVPVSDGAGGWILPGDPRHPLTPAPVAVMVPAPTPKLVTLGTDTYEELPDGSYRKVVTPAEAMTSNLTGPAPAVPEPAPAAAPKKSPGRPKKTEASPPAAGPVTSASSGPFVPPSPDEIREACRVIAEAIISILP